MPCHADQTRKLDLWEPWVNRQEPTTVVHGLSTYTTHHQGGAAPQHSPNGIVRDPKDIPTPPVPAEPPQVLEWEQKRTMLCLLSPAYPPHDLCMCDCGNGQCFNECGCVCLKSSKLWLWQGCAGPHCLLTAESSQPQSPKCL
ncbi:hypothetical protein ILYODFUR_033487 [Ilyodon furcidens]|uniref:Uncharacterized protein n=1 Tax=Ilyodon furcidens TaxID=33524 RepID=A0ABV0V898_9TELE